jgi:flagellar basal-body rod protein FlgB
MGAPAGPPKERFAAMDFSKLPLFSMISQRIGWLSERQKVLAENVANADTPNYKARDLKPQNFAAMASAAGAGNRLTPAATDVHHIEMRAGGRSNTAQVKDSKAESTLSGNTVSLESEMMKVAETAMDYQLITNLYRKQVGLIKTVIGRGGQS